LYTGVFQTNLLHMSAT